MYRRIIIIRIILELQLNNNFNFAVKRTTVGRRLVKAYVPRPGTSVATKSFRCPFCIKSYGNGFHLDRHTRIKHDVIYSENPVTEFCTMCDEAFCSKANLTRHVRIKHCDGEGMTQNKKCPGSLLFQTHRALFIKCYVFVFVIYNLGLRV